MNSVIYELGERLNKYTHIGLIECRKQIGLNFDYHTLHYINERADDDLIENLVSAIAQIINLSGTFITNDLMLISKIGDVKEFTDIRYL